MKLSKPVLFTIVGAIFVIVYLFFFAGPKKSPVPQVLEKQIESKNIGQEVVKEKGSTQEEIKKVTHVDARWLKDPFLLPKIKDMKEDAFDAPLKLSGIIEGREGRFAIVGSHIVKKGDFIGDEMVLDIEKDRILLSRKGKKKIISVTDLSRGADYKATTPEEKK